MNKKGVSQIIAIIILTLISILSLSLLFTSIISEEIILSPKQCLDLQINLPVTIEEACYNENLIEITLRKTSEEQINSIEFTVEFQEQTETWTCCEKDCPNCEILKQGIKTYYIDLEKEQIPKELKLSVDNCLIKERKINKCE